MTQSQPLNIGYEILVQFFEATEGNYRNALYIGCGNCKRRSRNGCGDFLFIPGYDCRPILLPLADAQNLMGHTLDRTECAGILSSHTFLQLYHRWLMLNTDSDDDCPFHQVLQQMNSNGK